jgi:hypothetical protein
MSFSLTLAGPLGTSSSSSSFQTSFLSLIALSKTFVRGLLSLNIGLLLIVVGSRLLGSTSSSIALLERFSSSSSLLVSRKTSSVSHR